MESVKAGIEIIGGVLGAMTLAFLVICLVASWLAGVVSKLLDSNILGAFLAFVFPPYGMIYVWCRIYKEETFK
jgi:hypothetical protein